MYVCVLGGRGAQQQEGQALQLVIVDEVVVQTARHGPASKRAAGGGGEMCSGRAGMSPSD